jgi:hypothetical protein
MPSNGGEGIRMERVGGGECPICVEHGFGVFFGLIWEVDGA